MSVDLDELERLEKAAPAGPWTLTRQDYDDGSVVVCIEASDETRYLSDKAGSFVALTYDPGEADAAFGRLMVAMRNSAPALIAAAREAVRMKEENARLRATIRKADIGLEELLRFMGTQEPDGQPRGGGDHTRIASEVLLAKVELEGASDG